MGASDYLENKVLDDVLPPQVAYTPTGSLWIELYTVAPTDAGGGTPVSGGGYVRFEVDGSTYNFTAAASGSRTANEDWTWSPATADWGIVVAAALFDASVAGNMIAWGSLPTAIQIDNGDTFELKAGKFTVNLD